MRIYNHALATSDISKVMEGQTSGIALPYQADSTNSGDKTFNLGGQRASKGLLVSKGRKFYKSGNGR